MSATHQHQSSHPPPYQTYTCYLDDPVSPTTAVPPTQSQQPYLDATSQQFPPHYTALPAFDSPRNYSRRLRRLIESRQAPLFLQLRLPSSQQRQQQLQVVLIDEKSAHTASATSNLLPSLPCDEEAQYSHQRRRSSTLDSDREISWLTFAGLAAILFMVICSCSIFVAWSTGLFAGNGGLITHMRVSSSTVTTTSIWKDTYRSRVEASRMEGYLVGEDDVATVPEPEATELEILTRSVDVRAKDLRRRNVFAIQS